MRPQHGLIPPTRGGKAGHSSLRKQVVSERRRGLAIRSSPSPNHSSPLLPLGPHSREIRRPPPDKALLRPRRKLLLSSSLARRGRRPGPVTVGFVVSVDAGGMRSPDVSAWAIAAASRRRGISATIVDRSTRRQATASFIEAGAARRRRTVVVKRTRRRGGKGSRRRLHLHSHAGAVKLRSIQQLELPHVDRFGKHNLESFGATRRRSKSDCLYKSVVLEKATEEARQID